MVGAAVAGMALAAALLAGAVFAQAGDSASVGDGSAAPGQSGDVSVTASISDPEGLGAWTLDISFDPAVLNVVDCEPAQGGVCNPAFADDLVRITGANATGLDGDVDLGTITFQCPDEEATSDLGITADVFADATIGAPQDIDVTLTGGTFTCAEPEPTVPAATPTTDVTGVPDTGTGGSDSGSGLGWVIAALAGAGLAAIAGIGALRMRTHRA